MSSQCSMANSGVMQSCIYSKNQRRKNMYCKNCGADLSDDVIFCPTCGTVQADPERPPHPTQFTSTIETPSPKAANKNDMTPRERIILGIWAIFLIITTMAEVKGIIVNSIGLLSSVALFIYWVIKWWKQKKQ